MTSRDFVFWLQGYLEIYAASGRADTPMLNAEQTECIRKHLALVFIHEIDPSMGPPEVQAKLNNAHYVTLAKAEQPKPNIDPEMKAKLDPYHTPIRC